jgi:hypothetical protein
MNDENRLEQGGLWVGSFAVSREFVHYESSAAYRLMLILPGLDRL